MWIVAVALLPHIAPFLFEATAKIAAMVLLSRSRDEEPPSDHTTVPEMLGSDEEFNGGFVVFV